METITSYFQKNTKYGGLVFETETEASISYQELDKISSRLAENFYQQDQKIITVILPNSIDYLKCFLAVLKSKNVFSPIPYFSSVQEINKILDYIDPYCIITDREDIKDKFSQKFKVYSPGDLVVDMAQDSLTEKIVRPEDIAALYYSSGTTGNPKGVLYSHHNMLSLIASICRGFKFDHNTRHLSFLPFGHTASINYNILPCLLTGASLYISKGFENIRDRFFDIIANYKISYTQAVPTVIFMLLKYKYEIKHLDLSCLAFIGCGSSTLPLQGQLEFKEKYNISLANLYGLSETGPSHVDDPREKGWVPGSIGFPLDVNECKLGDDGELLLKGSNIFVNYYKNEKLYNEVVQDGWFHTGDIGRQEGDRFFFEDRKKDLIIKAGINIVPAEVEEIIYKCPHVSECVVVGKQDPMYGEIVAAAIVPKDVNMIENEDDVEKLIQQVKEVCKNHLSNYKVPSIVKIYREIPKTYSGKLLRKKIREEFNGHR